MDKQRNVRRDITNSCADSMLNRITECFKDSLKGIPQIKSAVIDSINEDGSINIFFPPNETKLFTRISNQSPFTLAPGDGVEIMLKNGSFDNCWIIAKHGITRADMSTQQNKTSNDTLKNTNSNIDPSQVVGVTKTSQLINDSKFISQDEPIINSPDLRGVPTTPTASKGDNSSQIANTAFVFEAIQDVLEESKVLTFEGTIGVDGTVQELPDEHAQGDVYIISNSGLYAGYNCNIGDLIICIKDGLSKDDKDWYVIRTDLSNYITGPLSSNDNHVAIFDGDSGKIIKDSGYTIGKSVPSDAVFTDTIIEVVDSLDSTESEKALSANQGKILNDKVIKKADSSTTLSGYGIKDAKIENGVITLGENTITPITSLEDANLTGIPTAPTPDNTVNNNQIATTSFVHTFVAKAQESGVIGPDSAINEHVALFDGTTGKVIKDSGFTIGKSVPSDAVFTDTIVEVENNLDSTSTVSALSAYQGKLLKNEIDKKATSATTLGGYGITDAYIKDGKVKLGENEIIPIIDVSDKAPINSPNFTGTPTVPTANDGDNSEQIANTKFVSKSIVDVLEKSKVMTFQGTLGENGDIQVLPDKHTIGDVYIIISSGIYAGKSCGVGDLIICIQSGETDNNDDWYIIQTNIISNETDTVIEVVDSLNSTETKKALSANQGRVLDEKISKKANSSDSLNGYGILDAKIENNVITLGEHTITFIIDE